MRLTDKKIYIDAVEAEGYGKTDCPGKCYGISLCIRVLAVLVLAAIGVQAYALPTDTYAEKSVLASGKWVKVGVSESGMYRLTPATLRRWGFSDPSAVSVYGYGAHRTGDKLTVENFRDDLPAIPVERLSDGTIVFYAEGPLTWTQTASRRYVGTQNVYTTTGYYYIGESAEAAKSVAPEKISSEVSGTISETYNARLHHETEEISPGEAGAALVGEDFRYTPTRYFDFKLADISTDDTNVWMECSFVSKTYTASSEIKFTVNGTALEMNYSDVIGTTNNSSYYHGVEGTTRHTFDVSGSDVRIGVTYNPLGTTNGAWLNYLTLNYTRQLRLPTTGEGTLLFWLNTSAGRLRGIGNGARVHVWDISDILKPVAMDYTDEGGSVLWNNPTYGFRAYAAWSEDAKLPEPTLVGNIANQNLHGIQVPDMVIVTPAAYKAQAERIAELHRNDTDAPLTVEVVEDQAVYNEFSSGSADVHGLRRFFKMLYDRGGGINASGEHHLQYVLLLGCATYDHRHLTADLKRMNTITMPSWVTTSMRSSLNDNDGYTTDDFAAILEDNSGESMQYARISIALGRMPVRSLDEATSTVDKLCDYVKSSKTTDWRNQLMMLADDEDQGVHMSQSETFCSAIENVSPGLFLINKVYMDAYEKISGSVPGAREEMFRLLDYGTAYWIYLGHASNHGMSHEKQLTMEDINSLYLKRIPLLIAGTCDWLRWDSNTLSAGEIFFHERYGGTIATISATRPVYISENGRYMSAIGRYIGKRDEKGLILPAGEIYRLAKNALSSSGSSVLSDNHLRYVFMGDPAMRVVTPSNRVVLETIDGKNVPADLNDGNSAQIVVAAMQRATFAGSVTDPEGNVLSDFNGRVNLTIYDADYSTTSSGRGKGVPYTFDMHGGKLYTGTAAVKDGRWSIEVAMPGEIADNFRPATANMYAYAESDNRDACGVNHSFYVYGVDENAPEDNEAPVIESMYLNHDSFTDGGTVNSEPMLIAKVSDNVGINISTAGIGHQMTLTMGRKVYNDVSQYYTANEDGTPGGTIHYSLSGLEKGDYSLTLKVWDTSGNSADRTIDFSVSAKARPHIYDIWTDSSPASVQANFYLKHDRPDQMLTVTVTVYNMLGQPLWSDTTKGISDMYTSTPVVWNLTDQAGRRVPRGIYLYRAVIVGEDGEEQATASQRIAVTAQ